MYFLKKQQTPPSIRNYPTVLEKGFYLPTLSLTTKEISAFATSLYKKAIILNNNHTRYGRTVKRLEA